MPIQVCRRGGLSRIVVACSALASTAPAFADCDFSAADAAIQNVLAADGITDAGLILGSPRGIFHKSYFGSYDDTSVVPIASSSKMLAGVRIMQLVDEGVLDLDTPVSEYLSGTLFPWDSTAAPITLRQMFSHTSGYGNDEDDPVLDDKTITLEAAVQQIASNYEGLSPQNFLPVASLFAYGGVSMQIGGEVAANQSGVDWQLGWKQAIGDPLCVTTIDWQGLGATRNYHISGSARSSLDDYARVVAMLADGGVGNGTRILSPAAIQTMNHSQTGGATLGYSPPAADGLTTYGIGAWIEPLPTSLSLDTPVMESIGAFGYGPWVDFSNGSFGVIMVSVSNPGQSPGTISRHALQAIVQIMRAQLADNGGSCAVSTIYDSVFADGFEATATTQACPGTVPAD